MKGRVYIETTIVSYLCGRPSASAIVAAHQELTRKWWDDRAIHFEVLVSELVYREAAAGDEAAASARLEILAELKVLAITEEAVALAERLVAEGPIPQGAGADALHIAIAAVNGLDYLLTWNCKHLANAVHRAGIESLIERAGYVCPVICTPEELMED
ncbi:MAG: type II toxin-antitoxin system VapC family toxin [Phycisphaerae bacterium]|nr:type II toxin-antitoxin system VapC family toxin [Phycisphaerae bacterium]